MGQDPSKAEHVSDNNSDVNGVKSERGPFRAPV